MTKRLSPTALALVLSVSGVLAVSVDLRQRATPPTPVPDGGRVTLKAARLIDGRGNVLNDAVITVIGSKITAVGPQTPASAPITHDLGAATLMPGMIDVHVHPE